MDEKNCETCGVKISGGTFILNDDKKYYFCSNDCLEKFEEVKNEKNSSLF